MIQLFSMICSLKQIADKACVDTFIFMLLCKEQKSTCSILAHYIIRKNENIPYCSNLASFPNLCHMFTTAQKWVGKILNVFVTYAHQGYI